MNTVLSTIYPISGQLSSTFKRLFRHHPVLVLYPAGPIYERILCATASAQETVDTPPADIRPIQALEVGHQQMQELYEDSDSPLVLPTPERVRNQADIARFLADNFTSLSLPERSNLYFVAEDNGVDPLWWVTHLHAHGFENHDDLTIFSMNHVLFHALLDYACLHGFPRIESHRIPAKRIHAADLQLARRTVADFISHYGSSLICPEVTTFGRGSAKLDRDSIRQTPDEIVPAIQKALSCSVVGTDRHVVIAEQWLGDLALEVIITTCRAHTGLHFIECPPIIYTKKSFPSSHYPWATIRARTGPTVEDVMPIQLDECARLSLEFANWIRSNFSRLHSIVTEIPGFDCPQLEHTFWYLNFKWLITPSGHTYIKEMNVTPRNMSFVAEPVGGDRVWSRSPSELFVGRLLPSVRISRTEVQRDAYMRFRCGIYERDNVIVNVPRAPWATEVKSYGSKRRERPGRHLACVRSTQGDNIWNQSVVAQLMREIKIIPAAGDEK